MPSKPFVEPDVDNPDNPGEDWRILPEYPDYFIRYTGRIYCVSNLSAPVPQYYGDLSMWVRLRKASATYHTRTSVPNVVGRAWQGGSDGVMYVCANGDPTDIRSNNLLELSNNETRHMYYAAAWDYLGITKRDILERIDGKEHF